MQPYTPRPLKEGDDAFNELAELVIEMKRGATLTYHRKPGANGRVLAWELG